MSDFKSVGDLVYESYTPQRWGVITGTRVVDYGNGHSGQYVTVRWKNDTQGEYLGVNVKSLLTLVETTRRKLATHEKNFAAAERFRQELGL